MRVRPIHVDPRTHEISVVTADSPGRQKHCVIGGIVFDELLELLDNRGIRFVGPGEPYDISLVAMSEFNGAIIDYDEPFIISDHRDSGSLMWSLRKHIQQDNVIGVLTASTLRDADNQNAHWFDDTYQGELIRAAFEERLIGHVETSPPEPYVPPEVIEKKVRISFSYGHGGMQRPLYNTKPDFKAPRGTDVYFAGTTCYGRLTPTLHRWACVKELKEFSKHANTEVLVSPYRNVELADYRRRLMDTKIVVAPWGYGERTFREWEGLLSGCIVVRADTSWAKTWPDINETYQGLACRPDFADLGTVLQSALAEWDTYEEYREHVWDLLRNLREPGETAAHLADAFHYFGEML